MSTRVPALDELEDLSGFRPKTKLPEITDRIIVHFEKKKPSVDMPCAADGNSNGVESAARSAT